MAETTKQKKPSIFSRMGKAFKDYRSEFKKLVWPTKEQLVRNAAVVLISIIVVGLALWLVDFGLSKGIDALKGLIDFIRPVG